MIDKDKLRAEEDKFSREDELEYHRRYDPGKEGILGCDGSFAPENRQPHGALRSGKTREDRMPVEKRPRVIAAQKRAERMAKNG